MPYSARVSSRWEKSSNVPETRVDGGMAAFTAPDGPRAAGVVRAGAQGVVPALAEGAADRMDGRQVEHVETHGRHRRDPPRRAGQPTVRPWEQLVPAADQRPLPVHPQRGGLAAGEVGRPLRAGEVDGQGGGDPLVGRQACVLEGDPGGGDGGVAAIARLEQQDGLGDLDIDVLARGQLGPDPVGPGGVPVGPRLHHQPVGADRLGHEARPAQVSLPSRDHGHGLFGPALAPAVQVDPGGQDVVTVLEDDGAGRDPLAHRRLGREQSGRCPRPDVIDDNSSGHVPRLKAPVYGRGSMKALRSFTVRTHLPRALAPLSELARNLRWSWDERARDLFRWVDPQQWELSFHDPVRLLGQVSGQRLEQLAADPAFMGFLDEVHTDLRRYLESPRWFQNRPTGSLRAIAYFSPEFGIAEALPQYSGGLGVLAGDHLKAASGLGVPLTGVGLMYRQGYFRQQLNADGWQEERYPILDPHAMALTLVEGSGIHVELAGEPLIAQVWVAQVGRVKLDLLDADVDENSEELRAVTDRLYGGGTEHRIRQEILLGIGGVRALDAARRRHPGLPHQRGPRRLPRPRADPPADLRRAPVVRRSGRGGAGRHHLHHPHASPGRHRPLSPRPDGALLHGLGQGVRHLHRPADGLGPLPRRVTRRAVQHGGHGSATGRALQRRVASCTAR